MNLRGSSGDTVSLLITVFSLTVGVVVTQKAAEHLLPILRPVLTTHLSATLVETLVLTGGVVTFFVGFIGFMLGVAGVFLACDTIGKRKRHPVRTMGVRRRVSTSYAGIDECINCDLTNVEGREREFATEVVVGGVAVRTLERGTNEVCEECFEADSVEYGLRAEREDPSSPAIRVDAPGEEAADDHDRYRRLVEAMREGKSDAE